MRSSIMRRSVNFNPRSREGSDEYRDRVHDRHTCISIHAPARGATTVWEGISSFFGFQSTLPRGERHPRSAPAAAPSDFNPRSREGSDSARPSSLPAMSISIHAPARGATAEAYKNCAANAFQSTLPRGERHCVTLSVFAPMHFNPRSREGSDMYFLTNFRSSGTISIHAPARGATKCFAHASSATWYFNPRSREGSDLFLLCVNLHQDVISIHAPARGATYSSCPHSSVSSDFNPRSREGSDQHGLLPCASIHISIHAPARGATLIVRISNFT